MYLWTPVGIALLFLMMTLEAVARQAGGQLDREAQEKLIGSYGKKTTVPAAVTLRPFSYGRFYNGGMYNFGYDTGGGEHQSFRQESRDERGLVTGLYGYVQDDGTLRVIRYKADERGYRWSSAIYRPVATVSRVRAVAERRDPAAARQPLRKSPLIVGPIPAPLPHHISR